MLRSLWWSEEVMLLKEEMRRVRKTLESKASWWDDRQEGWSGLDAAASEGVKAYTAQQARIQCELHTRFTCPLVSTTFMINYRHLPAH